MKNEIGGFGDDLIVRFVFCGDDELGGLLADFSADAVDAAGEESRDVAVRRIGALARFDGFLQVRRGFREGAGGASGRLGRNLVVKTGVGSGVAGGAVWYDAIRQSISV